MAERKRGTPRSARGGDPDQPQYRSNRATEILRPLVGFGLIVAGLSLMLALGVVAMDATENQLRLASRLEAMREVAPDSIMNQQEAGEAGLVGRIVSRRVGIDAKVVEDTRGDELRLGVGHVNSSALPGEPGNVVLAAHRDAYFRGVRSLRVGDTIALHAPGGDYAYLVDSLFIAAPNRVDGIERRSPDRLTLVTSYPFHWLGPAPLRYVVRARPEPVDAPLAARLGEVRSR